MIILIDNYDSFTWNLYHFLGDLGAETVVHRNDKISVGQVISAKPEAIVISPGPATPNEAGICLELIEKASGDDPDLRRLPRPAVHGPGLRRQGGARAHTDAWQDLARSITPARACSRDLPQDFTATRYHSLIVERDSLPDCLEVTAETDGLIMGLQHKTQNVHGVQFHPESIASEHGHAILKNFLDLARAG